MTIIEAARALLERIEDLGNWEDGCFYLQGTAAPELQRPMEALRGAFSVSGEELEARGSAEHEALKDEFDRWRGELEEGPFPDRWECFLAGYRYARAAPIPSESGFSTRELFAALAMQGLAVRAIAPDISADGIVHIAVKWADALITALAAPQAKGEPDAKP